MVRTKDITEHYGAYINACMHISLKNKYLYVQTPKVASTTLKGELISLEVRGTQISTKGIGLHPDIIQSVHVKPYQLPGGRLNDVFFNSDYVRFCFVRDPYTRILSAFLDKIQRKKPEGLNLLRGNGFSDDYDLSFDEFLNLLIEDRSNCKGWDPHWRPQFHLLRPDLINYTIIGKIESFEKDYDSLNTLLGGKLTPYKTRAPHKTDAASKTREFYTASSRRIVSDIYSDDFHYLGYPVEN